MDNLGDCFKYNSFMSKKAIEKGERYHSNPNCDEDEQWKYDKLNSGDLSDQEMETLLKNEAYGNKDRDDKYNDLEDDRDRDDDDDNNDGETKLKNIGDKMKNLFD